MAHAFYGLGLLLSLALPAIGSSHLQFTSTSTRDKLKLRCYLLTKHASSRARRSTTYFPQKGHTYSESYYSLGDVPSETKSAYGSGTGGASLHPGSPYSTDAQVSSPATPHFAHYASGANAYTGTSGSSYGTGAYRPSSDSENPYRVKVDITGTSKLPYAKYGSGVRDFSDKAAITRISNVPGGMYDYNADGQASQQSRLAYPPGYQASMYRSGAGGQLRLPVSNDNAALFYPGMKTSPLSGGDVASVRSITVTRTVGDNEEYVASVTGQAPPKKSTKYSQARPMHVTGSVSGRGQGPYLEITWNSPGPDLTGSYTCVTRAVNKEGQEVQFSRDTDVTIGTSHSPKTDLSQSPSPSAIANPVNNEVLLKEIEELSANLVHTQLLMTKSQVNLEARLDELASKQDQLEADIATLRTGVPSTIEPLTPPKPSHTETGVLHCGESKNWTDEGMPKVAVVQGSFERPYEEVPLLFVSFQHIDVQNTENTRIKLVITEVTKTGFTVECQTFWDSYVWYLSFRWLSLE